MTRAGGAGDDSGVPPSIAAIMAAIRAEVAAPAAPPTTGLEDDAGGDGGDVAAGHPAPDHETALAVDGSDAPVAATPPELLLDREAAPARDETGDRSVAATTSPTAFAPDPIDVRAALAPLLREWLDSHLPEIVESAVHAEIRRLTGQAG